MKRFFKPVRVVLGSVEISSEQAAAINQRLGFDDPNRVRRWVRELAKEEIASTLRELTHGTNWPRTGPKEFKGETK